MSEKERVSTPIKRKEPPTGMAPDDMKPQQSILSKPTKPKRKKGKRTKQQKGPSKSEEVFLDDTEYFFLFGMRHVRPYNYTFSVHAKNRWYGREVHDLYTTEFIRYGADYYKMAIETGRITVNDEKVALDYKIKNGDLLKHSVHRHEPPVQGGKITIVFKSEDIVVVDKPSSIPVHPCGRYRHNSVVSILAQEEGLQLFTVHRLDRLTSGLVLLGRTSEVAERYSREMRTMKFQKTYLARVLGEFPGKGEPVEVDANIYCIDNSIGRMVIDDRGKEARTSFRLRSFNGHTSVVECTPITGRTHQIRIHLQHLGFPIANDPCYGGEMFASNCVSCHRAASAPADSEEAKQMEAAKVLEDLSDELCAECQAGSYWKDDTAYCSSIWLHGLSYAGPAWSYSTEQPDWAADDFDSKLAMATPVEFKRTFV